MSERARKPASAGRRRQLLKQRRQAAQSRQARENLQQPQPKRFANQRSTGDQLVHSTTSAVARSTSLNSMLTLTQNQLAQNRDRRQPYQSNRSALGTPVAKHSAMRRRSGWLGNVLRLLLVGSGISVMAGIVISLLHPKPISGTLATSKGVASEKTLSSHEQSLGANALMPLAGLGTTSIPLLQPNKELKGAKSEIQVLAAAQPDLTPAMFFYNPDTGAYLDLGGDKIFPAASTIKLPILIAFFQDIDAGRIRLDEALTMRKDLIASESGEMQYRPPGTKFTALDTADKMITISDNTATNMLIDRLGGAVALNQRFSGWGLSQTVIHNPLPDLQGTNTISPKDLSMLLLKISQGELLKPHSRDRALEILRNTITDTLLPQGLGEGAIIAHKTGDIGSVVGDAGLIDMPNGQRYVATVMVKRPHNDPRAQELIRQVSKITYQALSESKPLSAPPATAVVSTTP